MKNLLFSFALLASALNAQPLWQKTTVGMPIKQAQEMFPESKLTSDARDGRMLRLATRIDDHKFNVILAFDKTDRLESVRLFLDEQLDSSAAATIFQELATLLRIKYGKETSSTNELGIRTLTTWQTPEHTSIVLDWLSVGYHNEMNLSYSAALNKEADKL